MRVCVCEGGGGWMGGVGGVRACVRVYVHLLHCYVRTLADVYIIC